MNWRDKRKALFERCRELGIEFPGRGQPKNEDMEKAIADYEAELKDDIETAMEVLSDSEEPIPLEEVKAELEVSEEKPMHPLYSLPMDIKVTIRGYENKRAVVEAVPHNFGFFDGETVIGAEWQRRALIDWAEHKFGEDWESWLTAEAA